MRIEVWAHSSSHWDILEKWYCQQTITAEELAPCSLGQIVQDCIDFQVIPLQPNEICNGALVILCEIAIVPSIVEWKIAA